MAKYAYRVPNGTENDRVDASDLPLHGNRCMHFLEI